MIRWLRIVWPPWAIVLAIVLVYTGAYGLLVSAGRFLGTPIFVTEKDKAPLVVLTAVVAVPYACWRLSGFHPALRPDYRQWLSQTPWTSRKPLPLGPIHLVPQDVLAVALLVGLNWPYLQSQALVAVPCFFIGYLVIMAVMHYFSGAQPWAYAVGCGIGLMILFVLEPILFAVCTALSYGLAYLGLRASLNRFPWEGTVAGQTPEKWRVSKSLGWPYDRAGPPRAAIRSIAWYDALALGTLAGWLFFVISYQFRMALDANQGRFVVCLGLLGVGILIRVAVYLDGHLPPLSLMGRLAHGRWIIPGYDQVFVAPLLTILVALAAWLVPVFTGLNSLATAPVALALGVWILLGMSPSLRAWRLTGHHRIVGGLWTQQVTR
jgi:hypothetical protein